jgi:hypothetical protein
MFCQLCKTFLLEQLFKIGKTIKFNMMQKIEA